MELLVRNGDYVTDETGALVRAGGGEEVLQRVLWKLSIRKGAFPLLPQLGSRLYLLGREKPSERAALARQYVSEALADERELNITDVVLEENGNLRVMLEWNGTALDISVGGN